MWWLLLLSSMRNICWFHHFQSCTNGKGPCNVLARTAVYWRVVGRLRGILCSCILCSSTAWLQTFEVDHQTLAWVTEQLDSVGAVSEALDHTVWSCPGVMQFLGIGVGQDGCVQPHVITNLVELSMHLLVVQSLLKLLLCTSGLPHPVISSLQSLLELQCILRRRHTWCLVRLEHQIHWQLSLSSKDQEEWSVPSCDMHTSGVL